MCLTTLGLSSVPSSSNIPVVTNTPSMLLKKPESVSTSTSIVPYQTLSSIYNDVKKKEK